MQPVTRVKIMPPKPAPMLASPETDPTVFFGNTPAGNASLLARLPV